MRKIPEEQAAFVTLTKIYRLSARKGAKRKDWWKHGGEWKPFLLSLVGMETSLIRDMVYFLEGGI